MFLFPYAHDSSAIQRRPRITFALIFLNILIHAGIFIFGPNVDQPVEDFFKFYSQHPYLQIPNEMEQYFTLEMLRQLKESRQLVEVPSSYVVAKEQETLNK